VRWGNAQDGSTNTRLKEIRRFLNEYEFELDEFAEDIRQLVSAFDRSRDQVEQIQGDGLEGAKTPRNDLLRQLGGQAEAIQVDIGRVIQIWQESVNRCKDTLRREGEPVGVMV
jgi:prefoldin subunit 5